MFIGIFCCLGGFSTTCTAFNPAMVELMSEARPGAAGAWRFGTVLLGVSGGFVWYSAAAFLGLRAWARTSIEATTWLTLLACIGMGGYLITLLIRQPEVFFAGWGTPVGPVLSAVCGAAVVALLAMIRFLRGRTVREAFLGNG
jgi:hypothetical protein